MYILIAKRLAVDWQITYEQSLPWAVYVEIIAHVQQLAELEVTVCRRSGKFDYLASPVDYLQIKWQGELMLLRQILGYYGKFSIEPASSH